MSEYQPGISEQKFRDNVKCKHQMFSTFTELQICSIGVFDSEIHNLNIRISSRRQNLKTDFVADFMKSFLIWISNQCDPRRLNPFIDFELDWKSADPDFKGLAKLGNIVAETLLWMQMFPNLAARETCVAETNFAARKQKMFFLPGVKNIFASRT